MRWFMDTFLTYLPCGSLDLGYKLFAHLVNVKANLDTERNLGSVLGMRILAIRVQFLIRNGIIFSSWGLQKLLSALMWHNNVQKRSLIFR
mmetsp:Transcript_40133/g.76715  ORF Transcript_40133/g.76715 Transcript_40133/m.76715 type:complete len:90 (-) Transcript_40133:349-618(-)